MSSPIEEFTADAHQSDVPVNAQDKTRSPPLSAWERLSFSIAHFGTSVLLGILGVRGLYKFGRAFGTCEWLINYKRRKRFRRALSEVLEKYSTTPRDWRRHSREHFMRSRCDKLFYLVFDRLPRESAKKLFKIENQGVLDEAVHRGKGVYLALAHQGSLHVIAMLMALCGYRTAGVRDRKEGGLRRFVQWRFDRKYPEFGRTRMIFADAFPREVFRCFQDGFVLGSAMDVSRVRGAHQKTEEVSIFGRRQHFLSGPVRIARRCGAPVLQALMVPGENFQYTLRIVEVLLDPAAGGAEDAVVKEAIRRYARNLESFLRDRPELLTRV